MMGGQHTKILSNLCAKKCIQNIDKKYSKLETDTGIGYKSVAKVKNSSKNLNSVSRNQLEFL